MSTPLAPTPSGPSFTLSQLEVLTGFKEHLTRNQPRNVSPFSDDGVIRYDTPIAEYDVPDIHREARERIRDLLRELHAGRPSQVVILTGNPGMGKTHLINYFRLPRVAEELGYVLVCNSNHWKVGEFEECLLDWLVAALTRPPADGLDLLLGQVQAIAFQALDLIQSTPAGVGRYLPGRTTRLGRLLGKFFGSAAARVHEGAAARDPEVFRRLDFPAFAAFICDRFLAAPGNPFHRQVMHVLLRYLFDEDRKAVLDWLRGQSVGDHFRNTVGSAETVDRHYKAFEAIKLLVSLFTPDVTKHLKAPDGSPLPSKAFFFAFDQIEGRDELFDQDDDWFTFFAQLCELYNALPNVFVLFTMTLGLRNKLHPKMERQFKDRIREDKRFVLRDISDAEVLALWRQRLRRWLHNRPSVLEGLAALDNPYLPFDQAEVVQMSRTYTLREMVGTFDERFRGRLEELTLDVPLDFEVTLKEVRADEEKETHFRYVQNHLVTVHDLLHQQGFGDWLALQHGLRLESVEWLQTRAKPEQWLLQLQFCDPAQPKHWVRAFLVHLPSRYRNRLPGALGLLANRTRSRYRLWLSRHTAFDLDPEQLKGREEQVCYAEVPRELESVLRALRRVWDRHFGYSTDAWSKGEPFLLEQVKRTYLWHLFNSARDMLQADTDEGEEEPKEAKDLIAVTSAPTAVVEDDEEE